MLSKKYRPATFADLIGQESNIVILKEILKSQINTPLLFTGPFGSGKTSASRVLAKSILCQNLTPDSEPCCACQSCLDFAEDRNINYTEIDAASNGDVESIRNLREQVGYSSIGAKFKITNIDEAHNITKAGYNALLKQLEEGFQHHIFMFCTNEPEKMLSTVRSRCWRIHSQAVSSDSLLVYLNQICAKEKIQADEDALKLIAQVTAPHIRDALNSIDFLNYRGKVTKADVETYFQITNQNLFIELLIYIKSDLAKAVECLNRLHDYYDVDVIFEKLVEQCLILESKLKGVEWSQGYVDPNLLSVALTLQIDFLAVSSYLLKVERPLNLIYLKHLMLELNRILNAESTSTYGTPPRIIHDIQVINSPVISDVPKNVSSQPESPTIIPEAESSPLSVCVDISSIMQLSDEKPRKSDDAQRLKQVNVKTAFGTTKGVVEVVAAFTNRHKNKPVPLSEAKSYLDKVLSNEDKKT